MSRLSVLALGILLGALIGFTIGLNIGKERGLFENPFQASVEIESSLLAEHARLG